MTMPFLNASTKLIISALGSTPNCSMSGQRRSGFIGRIAVHSLRRTKAAMIYKATGNLRAIQILLGHSKIKNTVRFLGVNKEDALGLAGRTEI
jgi:integrase